MNDSIYDAIVVGSGHNGLVSAIYLAKAGWKTLVLERNSRLGGAIASGELTEPGYIHDLYATNQNLFIGSPAYRELKRGLRRHGLEYATSRRAFCCVFPNLQRRAVYQDRQKTLEEIRERDPEDVAGWEELYRHFREFRRSLLPIYGMPLPSIEAGWAVLKAAAREGTGDISRLGQIVLSSTRRLGEAYFHSREMRALMATWGMHLDFGPDVTGGAMFPFVEVFNDMEMGMSVVRGGASRMVEALAGLLREYGGEIRTEADVDRILVHRGQAVGVELADGERIGAGQAVVANLTPGPLFGRLLRDYAFPEEFAEKVRQFKYGPGTMMVHLALRDKPAWRAGEDTAEFAYVHIAPYVENLARTYAESASGYAPADPFLIVGQTTAVDPTRTPDGGTILWVQVRTLPAVIKGDAGAGVLGGNVSWDEAKEAYADRVIEKLDAYAPGIRGLILSRAVFSPADLERGNPNLVGGDSIGGSHHLEQNFFYRPFPGWSRYRLPVGQLYMVGAATWPGAGTNGTSGYLLARQLLQSHRTRNRVLVGGAMVGVGALATRWAVGRREERLEKEEAPHVHAGL